MYKFKQAISRFAEARGAFQYNQCISSRGCTKLSKPNKIRISIQPMYKFKEVMQTGFDGSSAFQYNQCISSSVDLVPAILNLVYFNTTNV